MRILLNYLKKNLKHIKKLRKYKIFSLYFLRRSKISYIERNQLISKDISKKSNFWGNLEFACFFFVVGSCLFYVHKKKTSHNETIRLIAAGVATQVVVDCITYIGDKINTKVKVDSFYKKKNVETKDLNYYFDKKFSHYKQTKKVKRKSNFGPKTLKDFFRVTSYIRGIQAALIFVVINSFIFYGMYKNLKNYLKDKFGIEGFPNFFLAAGISQFFGMVIAFPIENMKTRIQAQNFHYDSFYSYYKQLLKGKSSDVIFKNLRNEYSGFNSHLTLYVLYESVTFAIYESLMNMKLFKKSNKKNNINYVQVLFASSISGVIAALVTNPIDVYQINKQINPEFKISQLNNANIFLGLKERILLITVINVCMFFMLEYIGPHYYNVSLE